MLNLKKSKLYTAVLGLSFLAVSATGCGGGSNKNPDIAGVKYSATMVDGYFLLSTRFEKLVMDGGGRLLFDQKLPNSYLEIGPDFQSNGTLVTVALAIADVQGAAGVGMFDPTTLPGGRPLPGVSAGALPGMAIQLPKLGNIALYFGNGAFGVFVPVKQGLPTVTYRFFADGARVGNISVISMDPAGLNGGFLVLVNKSQVNSALMSAKRPALF